MRQTTRRDILRGSIAVMGLGMMNLPEWVLPALAQGETLVPFTDMPANFSGRRAARPACTTSAGLMVLSRRRISFTRCSTTAIRSSIRQRFG